MNSLKKNFRSVAFTVILSLVLCSPGYGDGDPAQERYWIVFGGEQQSAVSVAHQVATLDLSARNLKVGQTPQGAFVIVYFESKAKKRDAETLKLNLANERNVKTPMRVERLFFDHLTSVAQFTAALENAGVPVGRRNKAAGSVPGNGKRDKSEKRAPILRHDDIDEILPEVKTSVFMSNMDNNRVYCDGGMPIKDIIYSKEKGIETRIHGTNAFIKFLVKKNTRTGELTYNQSPAEFFIICGDNQGLYTLIARPKQITARTIKLKNLSKKPRANLSIFAGMPYEAKLKKIMGHSIRGEYEDSFEVAALGERQRLRIKPEIEVEVNGLRHIRVEGEGLDVYEYALGLSALSPLDEVGVEESDMMHPFFTKLGPVAITLRPHTLKKSGKTRLYIITKRTDS